MRWHGSACRSGNRRQCRIPRGGYWQQRKHKKTMSVTAKAVRRRLNKISFCSNNNLRLTAEKAKAGSTIRTGPLREYPMGQGGAVTPRLHRMF